jgi:hypothetical protein
MKKLLLMAVVLFAGLSVLAQETTIEKAEFDKVMSGSFRALMNQPHRTVEESVHESSFGNSKTKIVTEQLGAAIRSVFESDSPTSTMKTESIFINGKRFVRNQNSVWKEETPINRPQSSNDFETVVNESVYKSLGEGSLNDKKVKIYKVISNRTRVHKSNGNSFVWNETTTYYFAESGQLVKSESLSEQISKPKNEVGSAFVAKETKSVTKKIKTIEIDQNIKIEAPQIG